jgi:hypothetical protein
MWDIRIRMATYDEKLKNFICCVPITTHPTSVLEEYA